MRTVRARAAALLALGAVTLCVTACTQGGAPQASVSPSATDPADASGPTITRDVTTLGVLGDSISAAMNACGEVGDCTAASWVEGTDASVDSIASRIQRQTGRRPAIANGAVSGGTLATALQSMPAVVAAKPELVTIEIGGNDACQPSVGEMTTPATFRREYGRLLDSVLAALPKAHVLVLSVPNLYRMWQVGKAQPGAAEAWAASGACGALLANSGSASPSAADTARRDAVRARVQSYNASIAALCSAEPRCVGDGGALYAHSLTAADVSKIDDFHPSKLGQRKIAQLAWAALERAG